jgi:hypothetical protein
MTTLPSGLPEGVSDNEDLSRFLTQSGQFNSLGAKPAAFLPSPKHRNTSVFRIGYDPERLRQVFKETATGDRNLKGVAICRTEAIRAIPLDVVAEEPPPGHANIEGWPWLNDDPEEQKAKQLELAAQVAQASSMVRL